MVECDDPDICCGHKVTHLPFLTVSQNVAVSKMISSCCHDATMQIQNIPPGDVAHCYYALNHDTSLELGMIFCHHLMNGGMDMTKTCWVIIPMETTVIFEVTKGISMHDNLLQLSCN